MFLLIQVIHDSEYGILLTLSVARLHWGGFLYTQRNISPEKATRYLILPLCSGTPAGLPEVGSVVVVVTSAEPSSHG